MRDNKGVDLDERGCGEQLGLVEGGITIIRIYEQKIDLFLIRGVYLGLQLSDGFLGLEDVLPGCIFRVASKHVLTGGLTTLSVGLVMVP